MRLYQRVILAASALLQFSSNSFVSCSTDSTIYSEWMAKSIVSRSQGIVTGTGGSSELLQAGFTQKAFRRLLELNASAEIRQTLEDYITESVNSVVPVLSNATNALTAYPLDRFSSGNNLLALSESTGNASIQEGLQGLLESADLQPRNPEGGLWYFKVYPEWSYLDGMFSYAPFYLSYAASELSDPTKREDIVNDVLYQIELLWQHCYREDLGLLVHGYDDSLTAVWVNSNDTEKTGRSPYVWGRSLGWYMMALVDSLELALTNATESESLVLESLMPKFQYLSASILHAADKETGGWYQIVDQGGREKNYIESSASAMFVYSSLKGARLGLLAQAEEYVEAAKKAYGYIVDTFVVRNETDGTLGYNGTVSVCSLNSTATYEAGLSFTWSLLQLTCLLQ